MAARNEPPPICFRALPELKAAIDEAASMRHWSRTTWILHAVGQALDRDRDLFGMTDDEIEHASAVDERGKARWSAHRDKARGKT